MMDKLTTGWLCRDKSSETFDYVWFYGTSPPIWQSNHQVWWPQYIYWTLKQWQETYDLKPPAPGEKFLVEIEL